MFLLRADLIPTETAALLASAARVVLVAERGRPGRASSACVRRRCLPVVHSRRPRNPGKAIPPLPHLEFFNSYGGFADDGQEYVVVLGPGQATPAPWVNVSRQFRLRLPRRGRGRRLHLERQQPREPAHPLVERIP